MAVGGQPVERLRQYLRQLSPGARALLIAELERNGIGTARYLPSIHLQSYMRERYGFGEGMCPVSERMSARTLARPRTTVTLGRGGP